MSEFNPYQTQAIGSFEIATDAILLDDDADASAARGYGFWATCGLSLAVIVLFIALQQLPMAVSIVTASPRDNVPSLVEPLQFNGLLLALGMIFSMPWTLWAIYLLAGSRPNLSAGEYLGLKKVSLLSLFGWLTLATCLVLAMEAVRLWTGAEVLTEFVKQAYQTAGFMPFLWIAIVLGAPIFEEMMFRGFMFRGIAESPAGNAGAILITTTLWTFMHLGQYGWIEMTQIFMLGIVLGLSRAHTGSIVPAIIIHFANNLVSMIQTAMVIES